MSFKFLKPLVEAFRERAKCIIHHRNVRCRDFSGRVFCLLPVSCMKKRVIFQHVKIYSFFKFLCMKEINPFLYWQIKDREYTYFQISNTKILLAISNCNETLELTKIFGYHTHIIWLWVFLISFYTLSPLIP